MHRSDRLDQSDPGVAFRENIIVSVRYKSRVREIKKKTRKIRKRFWYERNVRACVIFHTRTRVPTYKFITANTDGLMYTVR